MADDPSIEKLIDALGYKALNEVFEAMCLAAYLFGFALYLKSSYERSDQSLYIEIIKV